MRPSSRMTVVADKPICEGEHRPLPADFRTAFDPQNIDYFEAVQQIAQVGIGEATVSGYN